MKKFGFIAAVIAIIAFAGCASSGGGGGKGASAEDGEPPFVVDLSTLSQYSTLEGDKVGENLGSKMRNVDPFTKSWDGFLIVFPDNFVDVSKYTRVTIVLKYFNEAGEELRGEDSMGQLNFITDLNGDWRGPGMGPGPNTPLKEMNIGGYSGTVNKDRGVRHGCKTAPKGMVIQRAQMGPAYIELANMVWHNGNYESK